MTKLEQAARQALEALEMYRPLSLPIKLLSQDKTREEAITALREALAEQAEQEPVSYVYVFDDGHTEFEELSTSLPKGKHPLYVEPQVDITDTEHFVNQLNKLSDEDVKNIHTTMGHELLARNTDPHPVSQELSEREMTMPMKGKCECVVKRIISSGDREYCQTCGWPIYTFDEHRARLLEEQK